MFTSFSVWSSKADIALAIHDFILRDRESGAACGAIVTCNFTAQTSPILAYVAGQASVIGVAIEVTGDALAEVRISRPTTRCIFIRGTV